MKHKKKLSVSKLAFGNIRMHKRQYILIVISIVLAMIFSTGTVFFMSCMKSSKTEIGYNNYGEQTDIMMNPGDFNFEAGVKSGDIESMPSYINVLSFAYNEKKGLKRGVNICKADEAAKKTYRIIVTEGRYPEKAGEIAVERIALARLGIKAELGKKITLRTLTANGNKYMKDYVEKTYTLVGILYDKKTQIYNFGEYDDDSTILNPAAFVSSEEQVELGGKDIVLALYKVKNYQARKNLYGDRGGGILYEGQPVPDYDLTIWDKVVSQKDVGVSFFDSFLYPSTLEQSNVVTKVKTAAAIVVILAVSSCIGIVNAFNTNLNERKKQIGLLRAVGTTKRQIISIFGREAFILCLICAPISILVSFFGVKAFAYFMGDKFIFAPDIKVLLIGTALSIICVMLAALIPLLHITKISPMQAIRNTELMRKMKNSRVHSQASFNPSKLIAKRNLSFSKARQVGICLFLVLTIVISGLSFALLFESIDQEYEYDYSLSDYSSDIDSFINCADNETQFTENLRQDMLTIPYIASAELESKDIVVNMLIDGEYPLYFRIKNYGTANAIYESDRYVAKKDQKNLDVILGEEYSEEYMAIKKKAGYSQNVYTNRLCASSEDDVKELEKYVIDGKINIDKINSGEEIVVDACEELGFYVQFNKKGYMFSSMTLDMDKRSEDYKRFKGSYNKILATAKSPFKAGDTITLSVLVEKNGKLTRTDKQVKIGAIVKGSSAGRFATTLKGLEKFPYQGNYERLYANLSQECTVEIEDAVQTALESIVDTEHISVSSKFENQLREDNADVNNTVEFIAFVALFVCISIGLVNNSITAQIHESKKKIGTLRAVGASFNDLTKIFKMQVATILGISTAIGFGLYIAIYLIWRYFAYYSPKFTLIPLAICLLIYLITFINLHINIKKMTKYSIVENIREL